MTPQEARERVARGAALLDEKYPGWADRINLERFDLGNACTCVLGQLEGFFWTGAQKLFGTPDRLNPENYIAISYGLWLPGSITHTLHADYAMLRDAWVEAIADRLIPSAQWTMREMATQ